MSTKVMFSLPDDVTERMKAVIPARQRSKIVARLLTGEIEKREDKLLHLAMQLEGNTTLKKEMEHWDPMIGDGLNDL
ncbi:MAG: hypothetical protein WC748_05065 [Legionellales bacterium]|jgi:hypothetical protein